MEDKPTLSPGSDVPSKTGLKVFGVLGMLLACGALLFGALQIVLAVRGDLLPEGGAGLSPRMQMISAMLYAAIGFVFGTIGWGTYQGRRWARVIGLFVAWIWLGAGVFGLGILVFMLPDMMEPMGGEMGGASMVILWVVVLAFVLALYVLLPAAGLIFYRHPKVKRAFDYCDPEPGWMDQCPLDVLGACLAHALCFISLVCFMPFCRFAFPFFGTVLNGWAGFGATILMVSLTAYFAWGTYRLHWKAWALSVAWNLLIAVSMVWTLAKVDPMEMNRSMGMGEETLAMMQKMKWMNSGTMTLLMAGMMAVWIGYLLWIGRHFKKD